MNQVDLQNYHLIDTINRWWTYLFKRPCLTTKCLYRCLNQTVHQKRNRNLFTEQSMIIFRFWILKVLLSFSSGRNHLLLISRKNWTNLDPRLIHLTSKKIESNNLPKNQALVLTTPSGLPRRAQENRRQKNSWAYHHNVPPQLKPGVLMVALIELETRPCKSWRQVAFLMTLNHSKPKW